MLAFILALASSASDKADAAVIDYWVKAAASDSQTVKYEALLHGLWAIDKKHYTRKRADAIALLYGSLLDQKIPSLMKHQICRTLAGMDGLDSSIDALLQWAGQFKSAAVAKKLRDRDRPIPHGSTFIFRPRPPEPDEERLADNLIASLWTKKSGGRSHFSGALIRFPPPVERFGMGFSR